MPAADIHGLLKIRRFFAPIGAINLLLCKQPRGSLRTFRLVCADLIGMLQGQCDIVKPVQQPEFPIGIDFKDNFPAGRRNDLLRFQVDCQPITFGQFVEQVVDNRRIEHDRQNTVLEAIVIKDIGETGRDNRSEAKIFERPRRMFA